MQPHRLAAGARTVAQMSGYFEELKDSAGRLAARFDAESRGYFKPTEEVEPLAIRVSYWQARMALLELIDSFRHDEHLSDEDRPAAFLVAFAAALLLIDAARFLRETAHHRPVLRRKLNESAVEFGIPAGAYDRVQRSLTSSRHAWHLFHAIRYFEHHEAELRALAERPDLAPSMAVIDRLRHRLDISLAQYAQVRLRSRASRMWNDGLYGNLRRAMYGLSKLGGVLVADRYVWRSHRPQLPAPVVAGLSDLLQPGDVLVVRKEYALTNYFLPGFWPHAALYLGDASSLRRMGLDRHEWVAPRWARLLHNASDRPQRVLEAMKDGVHIRSLSSVLASDSIVVLRPRLGADDLVHGLARGLSHESKWYDFDFDFTRSDRLVCTEVVYRAFDGVSSVQIPLTRRAGRLTLSGGDLIDMALERQHFEPVAVYAGRCGADLLVGRGVDQAIRTCAGEALGVRGS